MLILGILTAAGGIAACIFITMPDSSTTATTAFAANGELLSQAALGFMRPGAFLHAGFFPQAVLEVSSRLELPAFLILILIFWSLRERPATFIAFLAAAAGFLLLFSVLYFGRTRHQELLFVFALALLWIDQSERAENSLGRARVLLLAILLPIHVASGISAVVRDLHEPMSGAPAFARLLASHPECADAVSMGEPDYLMETFPYYLRNTLYVPREARFERWTHLTRANAPSLTMTQLLDAAEDIRARYQRPVVLYFGAGNPFADSTGHIPGSLPEHSFSWSVAERRRLLQSTHYLGYIPAAWTDEHYHVLTLPLGSRQSSPATPLPLQTPH